MDVDEHDCYLVDDGTLDTVIEVDGVEHRFNQEYRADARDQDGAMTTEGFVELCKEVIDDLE